MVTMVFEFGGIFLYPSVMATLGWQLDCIWNELQPRNRGHTPREIFAWVNSFPVWTLRQENIT